LIFLVITWAIFQVFNINFFFLLFAFKKCNLDTSLYRLLFSVARTFFSYFNFSFICYSYLSSLFFWMYNAWYLLLFPSKLEVLTTLLLVGFGFYFKAWIGFYWTISELFSVFFFYELGRGEMGLPWKSDSLNLPVWFLYF